MAARRKRLPNDRRIRSITASNVTKTVRNDDKRYRIDNRLAYRDRGLRQDVMAWLSDNGNGTIDRCGGGGAQEKPSL